MLYINGFDDIEATKYNYVCEYVICTRAPPPQRPLCCIILNQRQFEHGTTRVSFQKRKKKKKKDERNVLIPRVRWEILARIGEISWSWFDPRSGLDPVAEFAGGERARRDSAVSHDQWPWSWCRLYVFDV